MSEPLLIAVLSTASAALGVVGKALFDKSRSNGNVPARNGNGHRVEEALAKRAEVEFQIRMTNAVESITKAIELGNERTAERMGLQTSAMHEAAAAIREVHTEIIHHRQEVHSAVLPLVGETNRVLQELKREIERQPPLRGRNT